MSLIADALNAAQREKSGSASDVRRAAAETVLRSSPVRTDAYAGVPVGLSTPLRWAAIALGGALIVAAGLIFLAPDETDPAPRASSESAPQLPDPATTGRVDPDELPFLANLDPGRSAAATAGATLDDPDLSLATGPGGGPFAIGGSGIPGDGYPSAPGTPRQAPATGTNQTSPVGASPRQGVAAEPGAGRAATDGGGTPAAPSPSPSSSPTPATVIQGRFELSVAGSAIPVDDRMAEAVAAQQAGDTGGAIVLYEQILAQRPDHVEARNNLGIALHSRGDLGGARDSFRAAIALDPRNASAWSNLGAVLSRLGEMDEAQAALGEASRLDPTNLGARVNLANLLLARGLAEDARLLLSGVLQRDPGNAEANYAMGKTLDSQGDRPGAVRHYQAFLTYGAARFPGLEDPVRLRIQQLTAR